jgi:hypothetical protein
MQTVTITAWDQPDIEAVVDAKLEALYTWSQEITDSINTLSAAVTALQDTNLSQNRRINALKSRVTALEERLASGTYSDVY